MAQFSVKMTYIQIEAPECLLVSGSRSLGEGLYSLRHSLLCEKKLKVPVEVLMKIPVKIPMKVPVKVLMKISVKVLMKVPVK